MTPFEKFLLILALVVAIGVGIWFIIFQGQVSDFHGQVERWAAEKDQWVIDATEWMEAVQGERDPGGDPVPPPPNGTCSFGVC